MELESAFGTHREGQDDSRIVMEAHEWLVVTVPADIVHGMVVLVTVDEVRPLVVSCVAKTCLVHDWRHNGGVDPRWDRLCFKSDSSIGVAA